jgi:plastocyanin
MAAIECGATGSGTAVDIAGFSFVPSSASVPVGGMATWTNQDGVSHTVTFDSGPNCGTVVGGASETVVFNVAGAYPYHCAIHPDMTGAVTVE